MKDLDKPTDEKRFSVFYKTEEDFMQEVLRFLATRPKNCGATEKAIIRVTQAKPWVDAKKEVDEAADSTKNDRIFFGEMRRHQAVKCIKRLYNEGYSPKEIADALGLKYSTAWYHCNKIKKRIRARPIRENWRYKVEKDADGEFHLVIDKRPRDKAAIAADKERMRLAEEKRQRRAARRKGMEDAAVSSAA